MLFNNNLCWVELIPGHIFAFLAKLGMRRSLKSFSNETRIHLFCLVDNMIGDDLATQASKAISPMVFTYFGKIPFQRYMISKQVLIHRCIYQIMIRQIKCSPGEVDIASVQEHPCYYNTIRQVHAMDQINYSMRFKGKLYSANKSCFAVSDYIHSPVISTTIWVSRIRYIQPNNWLYNQPKQNNAPPPPNQTADHMTNRNKKRPPKQLKNILVLYWLYTQTRRCMT